MFIGERPRPPLNDPKKRLLGFQSKLNDGEIYLIMIGDSLVEGVMRVTYRQVERNVDAAHPVFKLGSAYTVM